MDTASVLLNSKETATLAQGAKARLQAPVRRIYQVPATGYVQYGKRLLDVVLSLGLSLLLLSWIIPLLFVLIKCSSRGPLFFVQKRVGHKGRVFLCLKFRTMRVNDDCHTVQASPDDQRITKLGQLLRTTHIDELPQLLNVLMNDMSLVGPRPHMLYHDSLFASLLPEYPFRHLVKPGITGLAQAAGYHGETPDFRSISSRTKLDLFYTTKVSLLLDLKILFATLLLSPFKHFRT